MKTFKKYYELPTSPDQVYLALTNPNTIALWTGSPAEMSTVPNSEFSLWDGDICGKNVEFEENKKIVQNWYFEGITDDSIVTIKLHDGKRAGSTSVELTHTNIPDDDYEDMMHGWDEYYFNALIDFFEEEGE
ncbi:MAG: SRPBCC domain-containing protein [Sphingobacteriales bacterium]|jgi:activator of HSP90 ATPase|nr:SRPBCC domain-containing protein [Sphingobacteriales bacterium]